MAPLFLRASPARVIPAATLTSDPRQRSADRRFRLPGALAARLDVEAEARGLTRADLIRTALADFFEHLEPHDA